jgi:hypothetical protein
MSNQADLAELRDIAESGRQAPLLGGRFFVWWGGLASAALLAHWTILTGRAGIEPGMVGFVWMVYGIVGGIGTGFLSRGIARKPGRGTVNNRGERAVWMAVSFAIFAYAIGAVLANVFNGFEADRRILFDTIPLVAFAGYGISFHVTAALGGPRWMSVLAPIAWLTAGAGLYFVGTPTLYLYSAGFVLVLAVLPGLLLMRGEPAAESGDHE